MQRILYFLLIITVLQSCEDVIQLELSTEAPRPVVDAIIKLDTAQAETEAYIKLSLTSSFFDRNQALSSAQVSIKNLDESPSEAAALQFLEVDNTGIYKGTTSTDFFTSGRLELSIVYQDTEFISYASFVPTSPIESLTQGDQTLFTGDETEVIISFVDNASRDDFYVFDFGVNEFLVTEDEFYQGQRFEFSYFYEDLVPEQTVTVSILGADEPFFNYMNQVTSQSGGDQGPFQSPVATVRGNIVRVSDEGNPETRDDFVLGYFAVVQEYKSTITIQ